jgi:hypothetical protein
MPLNAGTGVEVVLTRAGGHQTVSCQVVNGKLGVGRCSLLLASRDEYHLSSDNNSQIAGGLVVTLSRLHIGASPTALASSTAPMVFKRDGMKFIGAVTAIGLARTVEIEDQPTGPARVLRRSPSRRRRGQLPWRLGRKVRLGS